MHFRTTLLVASLMLGASLAAPVAHAQSEESVARAAARKLGYAGVESFQAGQFAEASEKLEKAYVVLRVPSLGLWSARALVKVGKLVEAADRYIEVTRANNLGGDVAVQKKAQADAQTELEATQALVPSVIVRISGAEPNTVKLTLDGVPMSSALVGESTPVNPGHHVLVGERGEQRVTRDVTVQEREKKGVELAFDAVSGSAAAPERAASGVSSPEASHSNTRRLLAYTALGVGGAGLIVGGITAALAASKKSSLDHDGQCANDNCPASLGSGVDSYNGMRSISTVGFIVGGAFAATGVVLLLTAPKTETTASLLLGPASARLRLDF